MQPKVWKSILFWTLLAYSGANSCCITPVDAAEIASDTAMPKKLLVSIISSMAAKQKAHQPCNEVELEAINSQLPLSLLKQKLADAITFSSCESPILYSQTPPETPPADAPATTPQPNPVVVPPPNSAPPPPNSAPPPREEPKTPPNTSGRNEPPQLEAQPRDFPQTSPTPVELLPEKPSLNNSQRLERLIQKLQENEDKLIESDNNQELGTILAKPRGELGTILARPRDLPPSVDQLPPPTAPPANPVAKFKPIGYLRGYVGFFETNNIFSSEVNPIQDGLVYSGLTLGAAPIALGPSTYLNASIDGNLIFYIDQSKFNYNQVRFNLGIYQQISQKMYAEIGLSNQQLFYAKSGDFFSAGDRFLNENSLRLSLGRRDPLTPKWMLDSYYEFRWNFSDPQSRSRLSNFFSLSLSYYWLKSLQVGLDYQLNLSNFTQRSREDQYHRLFTHLTYGISNNSSVNFQAGISLGGSTEQNINFDGWFFSLNYNWELGQF